MKKLSFTLPIVTAILFSACKVSGRITTTPPANTTQGSSSNETAKTKLPSFTFNPPSGWTKEVVSGTQVARYESKEIDTEKVNGGQVTSNAVIIIRATGGYTSQENLNKEYLATSKDVPNFQTVSADNNRIEFTYTGKVGGQEVTIHELDYLFYKDGTAFLVKGYSADSAWSKHKDEIQSALATFKFD